MRSAFVCLGIAAVLVAGCGKDDYEAKRPKLPTPKCEAVGEDIAKAFAAIVSAQDRGGDLAAVVQRFGEHRRILEAALAKRDPSLAQRLKPVLDKQFSDEALRARAACGFAALAGSGGGVAVLDEWSRKPEMRAINAAIWSRKPAPSEDDDAEMTPKRKTLLRDIATAMALQQIQASIDVVAAGEAAGLVAALDAPVAQIGAATAKRQVPIEEVVDVWLTPALIKIPDGDLADFLNFVESPFGADYYVALTSAYDFRNGDWYAKLYEGLREASAPGELPAGTPNKEAVIAEARNLLRNIGTPPAAADAMARLQQVERIDPRNAEVHVLMAEAAIKSAATQLGPDQLRAVVESPNYEQADRHLAKALELAPQLADVHMWTGRLRYLQGRDAEAMQAYQRAGEIDPQHPSLDLNLGDLFFEAQDYAKASRYYLAALSKPEGLPYVHYIAMSHLQSALRKGNRMTDYPRHADAHLAKYPDAWSIRLDYADYLMSTKIKADKIIAVAEPVPDDWQPARKYGVLSAALMRKASERVEKKTGEPIADGLAAMRRAISLNPDPRSLAEAVCRSGVDAKIAQFARDNSKDAKAVASAMVVCALRWQRADVLRILTPTADSVALSRPQPDLGGDTPLCYAAAIKDVKAFVALAKLQVNPTQKCNDGNPVAERLSRMAYGGDRAIPQMQGVMSRFYRKQ
jgi:tetratricopeptide (TPR) repeat protein